MTHMYTIHRRGFIRIEYIIAAVVCTLLLFGMVAVLVVHSVRPAQVNMPIRQAGPAQPEPQPSPAPAPAPAPAPSTPRQPVQQPTVVPGGQPSVTQVPAPRQTVPAPVVVNVPAPRVAAQNTNAFPNGQPHVIAGSGTTRIEAEEFDNGGEGVAYHDSDPRNEGQKGRLNEGVDVVGMEGGGTAIGYSADGEWVNYTVQIAQAGQYRVSARVAGSGGKMRILFDGADKTGLVVIPGNGSFEAYQPVEIGTVYLQAGTQAMSVVIANAHYNIDWIEFTPVKIATATVPGPTVTVPTVPGAPQTVPQTVPQQTVPGPLQTVPTPQQTVPAPTVVSVPVADELGLPKVTDDGFEDLRVGQRPTADGWDMGGVAVANVQRAPQLEEQALFLSDLSRTGDVWVRRTFGALRERAVLSARIRFGASTDGFGLSLQNGTQHAALILTSGMHFAYEESDGKTKQLAPFKPSTWYDIRIDANLKDKVYDIYVDGARVGERLKFRNSVGEINSWLAGTPGSLTGSMYIADIRINGK